MSLSAADFVQSQTQLKPVPIVPEIVLYQVTEMMPLWQFTEERLRQSDLAPPYWAIAWPGGQGLARYILDRPDFISGKRILDFAAGSGVAAIAAMKAGAKSALAIDIDPLALHAVALNAHANGVNVSAGAKIDMTKPYLAADIILAGDICYQQAMSTTLLRWLRLCVERNVFVLLADPGRAYVPEEGLMKLASYDVPTSRDIEDREMRTVTIWQLEKKIAIK